MEVNGTPFVCTKGLYGEPPLCVMPDPPMSNDRNSALSGDPVSPEIIAQMVKDSVERGQPNRELSTASRYLLLAATNICEEAFRNFSGFLDHFQSDEAEYWALDAKKAMDQTHRVLNVLAEIEGLDIP